jgi:siderophore synthetase component
VNRRITLRTVRGFAIERGIRSAEFATFYDEALLVAMSRLLQALYRENHAVSALVGGPPSPTFLELTGDVVIRTEIRDCLAFGRIDARSFPSVVESGVTRVLRRTRPFLRAVRRTLRNGDVAAAFDHLRDDFDNSFANLLLNRVLESSLDATSTVPEPASRGHHYYPFPGLRVGPSIEDVASCSHLSSHSVEFRLARVDRADFTFVTSGRRTTTTPTWSPLAATDAMLPIHPWHIRSPIIQDLLAHGLELLDRTIAVRPLASQRTVRVLGTGFDLKLPVDATLTSEHRLLYTLNCENASSVSAMAELRRKTSGQEVLGFQLDAASVFHSNRSIAPYLSMIVRRPLPRRACEQLVPALNLWNHQRVAGVLLDLVSPDQVYETFRAYCRVLLTGPVQFYVAFGMAFEPHLQNALVAIRDRMPVRLVLRDLDATILDPARVEPFARRHGISLSPRTWEHMPSYEVGGARLAHALAIGHLAEVMSYLCCWHGADGERLRTVLEGVWDELERRGPATGRATVGALREAAESAKSSLSSRLARNGSVRFTPVVALTRGGEAPSKLVGCEA